MVPIDGIRCGKCRLALGKNGPRSRPNFIAPHVEFFKRHSPTLKRRRRGQITWAVRTRRRDSDAYKMRCEGWKSNGRSIALKWWRNYHSR
jgi:hypothetical protein